MPSKSKPIKTVSADQQDFIDEVATIMVPWGMPYSVACLYGYLLLRVEPASLDEITVDLEMSKSSASVAARLLETAKLVRRHNERGTKRVRYSISQNYGEFITQRSAMIGEFGQLLKRGEEVASDTEVVNRLETMSGFYSTMQGMFEAAIEDLNKRLKDAKES